MPQAEVKRPGIGRVLINAQIAAPLLWAIHIGCPKNSTHCLSSIRRTTQTRGHSCADPRPTAVWIALYFCRLAFRRRPPSARNNERCAAVWGAVNSVGPLLDADAHPPG